MSKETDSASVLQQLMKDTDSAVSTLEARNSTVVDLESEFAGIEKKFEEAAAITEEELRERRLKILHADFESLREDAQKEENDLAQAVLGLNAMLESMGAEYSKLGSLNGDERLLIEKAENALDDAKLNRRQAEKKWFFKESAIEKADLAIARAESALEDSRIEARRRARQRLLKADIEASLQDFMLKVDGTIRIMEHRMGEIEVQLKTVSARKQRAFEVKEEAAKALASLDEELYQQEADLQREEEVLETVASGTEEHAAQSAKISNLRAKVEETRGKRNTAFVLHQSKDKFATELEIHEKTQLKLRDNQRMWITSLRSDTEERVVTFRSRLEAMKAASDQDVAKNLDDLGAEADLRNAEYMARVGAASDKLRMDKVESHPERIQKIAAVAAAQAEAVQEIRVREKAAIEHFKELYGIDPTASSFFHYQDGDDELEGSSSGGDTSGGSGGSADIF